MYDFLLALNLTVWVSLTIFYLTRPFASAFHPVSAYLLFHFIVFVFRPILAWHQEFEHVYNTYQFTPSHSDKITVQLATMLGLVCFVLPAMHFGNAPARFPRGEHDAAERRGLIRPFWITAMILGPIGLLSIMAYWDSRANDASTMVLDAATGHRINTSGNGYFHNFQLVLATLAIIFAWLYRFRWWSFAPLLAFIVMRAGTGGRAPFVFACAAVAMLYLYEQRRRWPNLRAIAIAALGLALFSQVGQDRGAAVRGLFVEDQSAFSISGSTAPDLKFMEGMDFANLEYFEFLVYAVPQRTGTHGYFLDNLQLLTQPIPRVLWEGKPIGPPIQLFSLFDHGHPIGMTYSLPGNGWIQLGYAGVAIWCGLFGWLFGAIHNRFQQSRHGSTAVLAYMIFIGFSIQFFRDGLLLVLVQTSATFILPVLLMAGIARLAALPKAEDQRRHRLPAQ